MAGRIYNYASASKLEEARRILCQSDVVLIHNIYKYHFDWAVKIAQASRIPYVVLPHGSLDPYVFTYRSWRKQIWLKLIGRRAISSADLLLMATQAECGKALRSVSPARHAVIPLTVDLPKIADAELRILRQSARMARGYTGDDVVLVFLGRFSQEKRPFDIIRAFIDASERAPNLKLLMVGPDGERMKRLDCEQYAAHIGARNARFEGGLTGTDKEALFAAADVVVNFSFKENFGYVACEALSYGVPVVVSVGNDLGKTLIDAGAACMPQGDSVQDLAEALLIMATLDREKRAAMGERGRRWVAANLNRDVFRRRLVAELKEIVSDN